MEEAIFSGFFGSIASVFGKVKIYFYFFLF